MSFPNAATHRQIQKGVTMLEYFLKHDLGYRKASAIGGLVTFYRKLRHKDGTLGKEWKLCHTEYYASYELACEAVDAWVAFAALLSPVIIPPHSAASAMIADMFGVQDAR